MFQLLIHLDQQCAIPYVRDFALARISLRGKGGGCAILRSSAVSENLRLPRSYYPGVRNGNPRQAYSYMHGSLNVHGLLAFVGYIWPLRMHVNAYTCRSAFKRKRGCGDFQKSPNFFIAGFIVIKLLAVCSVDGNRQSLFCEKLFETNPQKFFAVKISSRSITIKNKAGK